MRNIDLRIVDLRRVAMLVDCDYKTEIVAFELNSTIKPVYNSIQKVESRLGYRIFIRKGSKYDGLTEKGKEVIRSIRAILRECKSLSIR
jgi:hypothetical protein